MLSEVWGAFPFIAQVLVPWEPPYFTPGLGTSLYFTLDLGTTLIYFDLGTSPLHPWLGNHPTSPSIFVHVSYNRLACFCSQATHFVELCSQRDIPLVFCQNTVPQANSELTADQRACLLKDQAKLMTTVACAQVGNGEGGREGGCRTVILS